MSVKTELEDLNLCRAYIEGQLEDQQQHRQPSGAIHWPQPGPAVTVSYQTGAGAHETARELAGILQSDEPDGSPAWTVFDRQLVEKVLEEHHLPKTLSYLISEERRSYIKDVMEELLGLRPPSWVMVPQIAETVLHLAEAGRVILVGRGANFITARTPNVFHVHLIASLPRRIARVQALNQLTKKQAAQLVAGADRGRGRYVKAHFHVSVDDDLHYDLVVNTDRIPCPDAAGLIADAARRYFRGGAEGAKPEKQ